MKQSDSLSIKKPKRQVHDSIPDIAKRLKRDYSKQSVFSSYDNFEIDTERLLEISGGNVELVNEIHKMVEEQQAEGRAVSGFQDIKAFFSQSENTLGETKTWIHVVFDHGLMVTLIGGRVGSVDHTYKQRMDKSLLYSMATTLQR